MSIECWTWSSQQRIPSNSGAGKQVLDELLRQLEHHDWHEQEVFAVHLAVEEALVNAIKHGNRYDPEKSVRVVSHVSPQRVRIEIEDEGQGFDPDAVPDPTHDENLELPSGRGLMLMRSFMNRVEFNALGNRVVMEKARDLDRSAVDN